MVQDNNEMIITQLKAKLYDANEGIASMQAALKQVADCVGYEGDSLDELLSAIKKLKGDDNV